MQQLDLLTKRRSTWRPIAAVFAAILIALSTCLVRPAQAASTASLVNGDFETGDLTGWTPFTTTNGAMLADVVPFDTDGDGSATYGARFVVGQSVFEGDVQQGGGIFQDVLLGQGELSISADIASDHPFSHCNGDGGTVQLLVDGVVVDTHSFGDICGPATEYASLSGSLSIASAGLHEMRFLATRAATLSGVTNYLDDVALSGSSTAAAFVANLITLVDNYDLDTLGTSLQAKLMTVQRLLITGKTDQACETLNSFLAEVAAQSRKGLTLEQASELTGEAQRIETLIGC